VVAQRDWPFSCSTSAAVSSHLRDNTSGWCEVIVGRTLAACVHPLAAWHCTVRSFRVLLLVGYFAAGYVAILAALVWLN